MGESESFSDAVVQFARLKPDVVFMDIGIEGENGVECARLLADMEPKTKIIFATAHSEYMPGAFELYAFDYLVKPFDVERVERTLDRIKTLHGQETVREEDRIACTQRGLSRLLVKGRESMSFVDMEDIVLIQRENNATVTFKDIKRDALITQEKYDEVRRRFL